MKFSSHTPRTDDAPQDEDGMREHARALEREAAALRADRDALAAALGRIAQHAYDDDTTLDDLYADFDAMRDIANRALFVNSGGTNGQ